METGLRNDVRLEKTFLRVFLLRTTLGHTNIRIN